MVSREYEILRKHIYILWASLREKALFYAARRLLVLHLRIVGVEGAPRPIGRHLQRHRVALGGQAALGGQHRATHRVRLRPGGTARTVDHVSIQGGEYVIRRFYMDLHMDPRFP